MLYQLCRTDSMNFRYNKIIVIHALRSVLLRKVYIAKRLRKHFTELVMCLYIHLPTFCDNLPFLFSSFVTKERHGCLISWPCLSSYSLFIRVTYFLRLFHFDEQIPSSFFRIYALIYRYDLFNNPFLRFPLPPLSQFRFLLLYSLH